MQNTKDSRSASVNRMLAARHLVMPGNLRDADPMLGDYNRAYAYWKWFWSRLFAENGVQGQVSPDTFFRQERISILAAPDAVVGMSMHTLFNLESLAAREHSYMEYYHEPFWRPITAQGVRAVVSFEYLTVNPDFRRFRVGVSIGAVLIGLGLRLARDLDGDAAVIAPARRDLGVHRLARDQGAVSIIEDVMVHGTPCDLIVFYPSAVRLPSDPEVAKLIEYFWERSVLAGGALPPAGRRSAAA